MITPEICTHCGQAIGSNKLDADKLLLLADWFEAEDKSCRWGDNPGTEVQDDLRRIARILEGKE